MSKGLGASQRAMLALLATAAERNQGIYVGELAKQLGLTHRRTHQVIDSLRERQLIYTEVRGWRDDHGQHGPLVARGWREPVTEETPGARWVPWYDGASSGRWMAPGGLPKRGMIVFLGDPRPGPFGTPDRWGR